jgi:hypothetical protein
MGDVVGEGRGVSVLMGWLVGVAVGLGVDVDVAVAVGLGVVWQPAMSSTSKRVVRDLRNLFVLNCILIPPGWSICGNVQTERG